MSRAHDVLCPYCFTRWSTRVAAFRCTSRDEKRCKRVPDEALGRLRRVDPPLQPKVIVRSGRIGQTFAVKTGQAVRCDCGAPARPVCPSCHSDLPQRFADAPSRSMALIGTRASGKSHFIAVALHELEHRIGPRFGGSLMLLDDATRRRVDDDLKPRLYDAGLVLPATNSVITDGAVRAPLVSRLTLGRGAHSNLVFFDAAGEDLQSLEVLEREGRYVTQSDGLVLLVDPLQIATVRDDLAGSGIELPPVTADVYKMLGRLAALMREARGIPAKKPIEVPLAIAISKIDALRGLLSDTHPVFTLPTHDGSFDRSAAHTISESMRSETVAWLGPRVDTFLKAEFRHVAYFGVSALGEQPVGGRLRNGVSPYRVEDPILWMLDHWGVLPR
jgi:hypothetical protein